MSDILAESNPNNAFGLDDVTIGGTTYNVASVDVPFEEPRVISRPNSKGVRDAYVVTKGSDPIQGTFELERDLTTTPVPTAGTQFTYDVNDDGTDETYQVLTANVNRTRDNMDTITLSVIRLDDGFGNL